ncbi:MAG: 2-octaprenyl-6-methoxyphenol hydroxylase [Halieaceae bacterium]
MKNVDSNYDVVIAGGGMVGASLALRLAKLGGETLRILLVESFPLPDPASSVLSYSPSFDSRATALSYSSKLIYQKMGVWTELARHACPISRIHVSDRGRFGSTLLNAEDYGWDALGHVVENAWLGRVLIDQLHTQSSVEMLSPMSVSSVAPSHGVDLTVSNGDFEQQIHCQLLVVADGANSRLRSELGMDTQTTEYRQSALIANIGLAQSHGGMAFERFTSTGPIAMLPLPPDAQRQHRAALVWTVPGDAQEELLALPDAEFLQRLQSQFGYRLGRLVRVGERGSYPLSLVRAREQVRSGVVVMGNAAHSLHPVAGQGYNLALRDVEALCRVLGAGIDNGCDIGSLEVLGRYATQQNLDQERTIGFSDRITGVFSHPDPVVGVARDLGLVLLDIMPDLKQRFVSYAAGTAGFPSYGERDRETG